MTLDDILKATGAESQARQAGMPLATLRRKVEKMGPTRGFARALQQQKFSVIAEIKRRSPSMGVINDSAIKAAHQAYHAHPLVSAISVLTQNSAFGGSTDDLEMVRRLTQVRPKPILRKDFIFSEYEVYYSRWIGADAILLMANVVTDAADFKRLYELANSLGLDVLCEVHQASEIPILPDGARICGINSRRFKDVDQKKPLRALVRELIGGAGGSARDTQTDLAAFDLFRDLPGEIRVAESGISSENVGEVLSKYPFNAALIGTALLKSGQSHIGSHLSKIQRAAFSALERPGAQSVETAGAARS